MNKPEILILYNKPLPHIFGRRQSVESDAGVLQEVEAVAKALERLGYRFRTNGVTRLSSVKSVLRKAKEQVIFNLVEYLPDSPTSYANVPLLCKVHRKKFTGNNFDGFINTSDKSLSKDAFKRANIPFPKYKIIPLKTNCEVKNKSYPSFEPPYIVKPSCANGSEGISVSSIFFRKDERLFNVIREIHRKHKCDALIEKFIEGREFNVSIICKNKKPLALPISEIDFSLFPPNRPHIVDYDIKWKPGTIPGVVSPRKVPADVDKKTAKRICRTAIDAWRACKCCDYARVDMRMDEDGNLYVLEVNANPDISPKAGLPAALNAAGIHFDDFVELLISNALARC
ncbi:TPA: ATP-grasp domain-containing protein [bacterium]|nr:ATP-grasp domain-containing protein [bacterium]